MFGLFYSLGGFGKGFCSGCHHNPHNPHTASKRHYGSKVKSVMLKRFLVLQSKMEHTHTGAGVDTAFCLSALTHLWVTIWFQCTSCRHKMAPKSKIGLVLTENWVTRSVPVNLRAFALCQNGAGSVMWCSVPLCHVKHKEPPLGCLLGKVVWRGTLLGFGLENRWEKGSGEQRGGQVVSGRGLLTAGCTVTADESPQMSVRDMENFQKPVNCQCASAASQYNKTNCLYSNCDCGLNGFQPNKDDDITNQGFSCIENLEAAATAKFLTTSSSGVSVLFCFPPLGFLCIYIGRAAGERMRGGIDMRRRSGSPFHGVYQWWWAAWRCFSCFRHT